VARKRSITRTIWDQPSPSDFKRWEDLIVKGADPSHAAKELGFGGSSTFKRVDPVKHAEVLEVYRERRDADDRKLARDVLREIAADEEAPPATRVQAAQHVGKAGGLFDDTQRVELTGKDGGPIEVERTDVEAEIERIMARLAAARADQAAGPPSGG
jgi:hypothetical protein